MTTPTEAQPLLQDGLEREDYQSTSTLVEDDELGAPEAEAPARVMISRSDLIWVLAGLWSAVFLGALDGAFFMTICALRQTLTYLRQELSPPLC
jgi:hypothetical protein